jgi:hypothetical protein
MKGTYPPYGTERASMRGTVHLITLTAEAEYEESVERLRVQALKSTSEQAPDSALKRSL